MNYDYLSVIDEKKELLDQTADAIWATPELAFTEFASAKTLMDVLKQEGFEVEDNLAGIKTAFSGRFGSGKPVIGILGEFDALSGLGQEAGCTVKCPDGRSNGQGCGHNLLGVGSLAAALAVKKYLQDSGASGTVIYFGTPGEEGGSGKAFMARDHVFDELDAAVCWHPGSVNEVRRNSSLANYQIKFTFDGKASHASGAPAEGRSALDALELMNIGVQFLREHMPSNARVHYAITDAGGISPNVVQPHAEALYLIRSPKNAEVKALYERVLKIAQGAAMMTETEEHHEFIKACSNVVLNDTLQREMQRIMEELTPPEPTEADLAFGRELSEKSLNPEKVNLEQPYQWKVKPYPAAEGLGMGSTDTGDTSWVCPMVQMAGATWCKGTPGHSWQVVAQGKTPFAHEVTRYAGKVMAATMVSVINDPELLQRAKAEHRERVGEAGYIPPIPEGVKPRALVDM